MRILLLVTLITILTGCVNPKTEEKPKLVKYKEGVEFLDNEKIKSSFCYRYSEDEGKLSARKKVKSIALREAVEAFSVKITSIYGSKSTCRRSKEICQNEKETYFKQVSNNFYKNVTISYTDISSSKVCVSAIGNVIEIVPKKKPKKIDNFVNILNKDFNNDKEELGEPFKDYTSYIIPSVIKVKAGSFFMGSNLNKYEKPKHTVTIDYDFYLSKYELSKGEFRKFIEDSKYITDAQKQNSCIIYEKGKHVSKQAVYWDSLSFYQGDNEPVVCVSFNDAQNYIKWLNQKSNSNYRLPTESEWEFVAKAGTTTKWSFGDDENQYSKYAWYSGNSSKQTHPIGTKKKNSLGFYDLYGNVWEWCEDSYDYYTKTPRDGSAHIASNKKVLRGASWMTRRSVVTSRWAKSSSSRYYAIGFRLALDKK